MKLLKKSKALLLFRYFTTLHLEVPHRCVPGPIRVTMSQCIPDYIWKLLQ